MRSSHRPPCTARFFSPRIPAERSSCTARRGYRAWLSKSSLAVHFDGSAFRDASVYGGGSGDRNITYERLGLLERLVESVDELTTSPYQLVVADDGSRDGTAEWCRDRGLRVIFGENRGVAWNKNRALFALAQLGCDAMVLLEDDAHPVVRGWERDWIEGTRKWDHLACDPKVDRHAVSGTGTSDDPFVSPAATGFCMSVSADVLGLVGFYDSRFRGYGHEHAEWTTRIKRAGYGFRVITLPDGRRPEAQLFLTGGLAEVKAKSSRNFAQLRVNREVGQQMAGEPVFRRLWRTYEARASFLAEQASAEIDGEILAAKLDANPRYDALIAPGAAGVVNPGSSNEPELYGDHVVAVGSCDVDELKGRLAELEVAHRLLLAEWRLLAVEIDRAYASSSWRIGHGLTSTARRVTLRPTFGTSALGDARARLARGPASLPPDDDNI